MPADFHPPYPQFLIQAAEATRHWMFDLALPLWWTRGADHAGGGFHEKLDMSGHPVGHPSRVRVQARQVFVFARAGALGWQGPWRQAMRHGLDFMLARHQRADGFFRSTLDETDHTIDLYDQAFVLFALAHAWQAGGQRPELLAIARRLMAQIDNDFKLPDGGYRTQHQVGQPLSQADVQRQSNPLMHLLEALLTWVDVGRNADALAAEAMAVFRTPAVALCHLAIHKLIDPETGALGEHFSTGWSPLGHGTERLNEPGHQFEWAWLLVQAQALLGNDMPSISQHAQRLERFGRLHGIDESRGVAMFSVDAAGHPLDRRARLWAQTERLRTSLLFAEGRLGNTEEAAAAQSAAIDAFATLQRFLQVPTPGLWHEWMNGQGGFELSPSPASTLYHLMTGYESLLAIAEPASTAWPDKALN